MTQDSVIQQFAYETEGWSRLLSFLQQENVYFKTRLSEIVNSFVEDDELQEVERFQEEFLDQDRIISYLAQEVYLQHKLLEKDPDEESIVYTEVIRNQKKLRRDIRKAEDLFSRMKDEFAQYLVDRF